jgi:FkbM family methyltransferase
MNFVYDTPEYTQRMSKESKTAYRIPLVSDSISRILRGGLRSSLVCVDLGSHIGTFAKFHSRHFSSIYGYEPSEVFFLASKLACREKDNIYFTNKGISRMDNQQLVLREVVVAGLSEGKDVTSAEWDEKGLSEFPGELGPIHSIANSISWKSISEEVSGSVFFLKCDIEGGEYEAFITADLSNVSFLAMELHYTALGPERTKSLLQKLKTQFEFIDSKDDIRFRAWPPPAMVYLVNKGYRDNYLWATKGLMRSKNLIRDTILKLRKPKLMKTNN